MLCPTVSDGTGNGLTSSDYLGFPDPFAVATIGGEQTHTTSVIRKTLNPYWNETFDLYVFFLCSLNMFNLRVPDFLTDRLYSQTIERSMRIASLPFRSLTRRSSRRRTRAFWE
jgi:Ca2+-dependent lipid-binding protein